MIPKILKIQPLDDLNLLVTFDNNTVKTFDVKPYLKDFEAFKPLTNEKLFRQAKVDVGGFGIVWNDDIDIDRYDVWEFGV